MSQLLQSVQTMSLPLAPTNTSVVQVSQISQVTGGTNIQDTMFGGRNKQDAL